MLQDFLHKHWRSILPTAVGAIVGFLIGMHSPNAENISHSELFDLKQKCAQAAEEFARNRTGNANEFAYHVTWKVLHSTYNTDRKSCFAEFDRSSQSPHQSESFSEYQIYDVLNNAQIDGLTYWKSEDEDKGWAQYYSENLPGYNKVRQEIFGIANPNWL